MPSARAPELPATALTPEPAVGGGGIAMTKLVLIAVVLGAAGGIAYVALSQARRGDLPSSYAPIPWSEGQWRRQRIVERGGRETLSRIRVVRQDADGFLIEQEDTTKGSDAKDYTRVLFERQPSSPEEALDVARAVEIRSSDGKTTSWNATEATPDDGIVRAAAAAVVSMAGLTDTAPGALQDVSVPAGRFRQCMRADATVAGGRAGMLMTGWFHPSVPLGGLVQGRTADGATTMELVDFGVPTSK